MKQIICIILIFTSFETYLSFGQSRFGTQLPDNAIEINQSVKGIFYTGIDNRFQIHYSLLKLGDTLIIETNNGIVFYDSISYVSIPKISGKCRLMLYAVNLTDTLFLGFQNITVENVPKPKIRFNEFIIENNTTVPKQLLIQSDSISVFYSNDIIDSDSWVTIDRFLLGYSYGGYFISHTNEGNIISEQTKKIINTISPEKQITIKVVINSTGKVIRELPIYRINLY